MSVEALDPDEPFGEWAKSQTLTAEVTLSRRERERFGRHIAAVFDVPPWMLGIGVQPLAIDGHAYHRRQRNRIKRRRR
jgi:hypothetical protein